MAGGLFLSMGMNHISLISLHNLVQICTSIVDARIEGGMGINVVMTVGREQPIYPCFLATIPATINWICFESSRRALAYIPSGHFPHAGIVYV